MSVIDRIKELGYILPEPPEPVGSYVHALKIGNLVYTSGILPFKDNKLVYNKEIGGFLNSINTGYEASKLCVLNALSIINNLVGLDNVERVVKLTGYINSATSFTDQPKVLNGASDLLVEIFGEKGKHVRSAIGVSELPLDASVEIEIIVQVKSWFI